MCGITGILGHQSAGEDLAVTINEMMQAMIHRGPDGTGFWYDEQVALGHVRLAIIDLESGDQPMPSADGRYQIAYNGEIYNFRELRRELTGLGHHFTTTSDTEVLLAAWQQWGIASLPRLNGMFAFAIWDRQEKKGFLARDPMGIKPLFYSHRDNELLFGSEAKAIIAGLSVPPPLDLQSLHLLMNFRYLPGDRTMWEGLRQLPPGSVLVWQDGRVNISNWGLDADSAEVLSGLHGVEDHLASLVEQGVQRQLVSDVPLGGYLSAGIDSGTLTAIAVSGSNSKDYPTFTIKTGDSPQEAAGAARTADILGVANTQEEIRADLDTWLPWLMWHLEVPKVNALQSSLVARLASRHVKVALSGLGGDEIFFGYNIHRYMDRLFTLKNSLPGRILAKPVGRLVQLCFCKSGLKYEEFARAGQALSASDMARAYGILRNIWDSPEGRKRIYGPRMLAADLPSAFDVLAEGWPSQKSDPVEAVATYELGEKMVNDFLWNEDRVSMASGLEVRVPFLDLELVKRARSLPRTILMPAGKLKGLLRKIVCRWLPAEVVKRPKSGFQVPAHEFYLEHLRPLVVKYLTPERMAKSGLFNPDFVQEVVAAKPHPRLRWHYFILYLMVGTEIWLDLFEKTRPEKPETP